MQRLLRPWRTLRPEAVLVALPLQPLDARRHVEPELATGEDRAGTAPHQLAALVPLVRRDQLGEPLEILLRRRRPLEHEPDPGLARPEAALGVLVGEVGRSLDRLAPDTGRSPAAARRSRAGRGGGAPPRRLRRRRTASRNRVAGSSPSSRSRGWAGQPSSKALSVSATTGRSPPALVRRSRARPRAARALPA